MPPSSNEVYVKYTLVPTDPPSLTLSIASKEVERAIAAAVISATGNDPFAGNTSLVRTWEGEQAVIVFNKVLTAEQRRRMENTLDIGAVIKVNMSYSDVLKEFTEYWR